MPLIKTGTKRALKSNFDESRHGNTFKRTEKKFGKKKAVKQMQAIALSTQRKATRRKRA